MPDDWSPDIHVQTSKQRVGREELNLISRDLRGRTGVEAVLIVVSDAVDTLEVLSLVDADDVAGLEAFAGRAVRHPAPLTEILDDAGTNGAGLPPLGLSSPLHLSGDTVGALCAAVADPSAEGHDELSWLLDTYGRLASMSLQGRGMLGGLLARARYDRLTGCLNYASLLEELNREIDRARRQGLDLACCFVDLDRYKQVNDRFGHTHGNHVLAAVGRTLRRAVRNVDTVGRYGGDEFVVVLPGTSAEAALVLAERIRCTISAIPIPGQPEGIGASVGVAQWRDATGVETFLGDADRALTEAKEAGGGCVVVARGGGTSGHTGEATNGGLPGPGAT